MTHGGAPKGWLEFSANLNPTGTSPMVAAAIASATYGAYADLDPTSAVAHLAEDAGVSPDSVLVTAGATEAIRLVLSAVASNGRLTIVGPTYSEYARVGEQVGASVGVVVATPPAFDPPIDRALSTLDRGGALVLCDPNNPTGRALRPTQVQAFVDALPRETTLVLDQSFAPFASERAPANALVSSGKVVMIRSFTKVLALPGIRLGYVIASPEVIASLRTLQDPWSVGAHALAVARVASWQLAPESHALVRAWRERLAASLASLDLPSIPSEANFLFVQAGVGAERLVATLAQQRIAVRPCLSFGLPEYVRIAVRPPEEQYALLGALAAGWNAK